MTSFQRLDYQRTIIGYHGCDKAVAAEVLQNHQHLRPSENTYDWLGKGVYFWEHAPRRALEFAHEQKRRGKVEEPAVLGAYIHLGRCFDLADVEHTRQLKVAYERFELLMRKQGKAIPKNRAAVHDDHDLLLRELDCALINWYMGQLDRESGTAYAYQTLRGVFQEGAAAFEGSTIREKSHIQICVRDTQCVIGYFLPTTHF